MSSPFCYNACDGHSHYQEPVLSGKNISKDNLKDEKSLEKTPPQCTKHTGLKKYKLCKILQSGLLLVPRSVQAQTNLDFVRVSFAYIYPTIWQQNHQPEYSSPKAGVAHNSKK